MLKIGRISYANCSPLFGALVECTQADQYCFVSGVPANLNSMLAAGEIDVCPSSSFEYACRPDRYLILPGLSISSDGPVGSVLLFSRLPLEKLDGAQILLSNESATSVNLLKVLLAKRFKMSCRYITNTDECDEFQSESDPLLLIGDAALRTSLRHHSSYVYDLGQLWREWTGLPFVFALWLCRFDAAGQLAAEMNRLAAELLDAKIFSRKNLRAIAERSRDAEWMGIERLVAYWSENISYDLDQRHLDGLMLFYRYCTELGLLPSTPDLRFLGDS